MEFNELEKMIANCKVGPTFNQIHTKLHLAKNKDRPRNVEEHDWIHDMNEARDVVVMYMLEISEKDYNFSEDDLFSKVKEIAPEKYGYYLKFILRNYNKFGVLF